MADSPDRGFESLEQDEARKRRKRIQDMGRRLVPRLGHYMRIQAMYEADNETPRRALQEIVDTITSVEMEDDAVALVIAGVNAFVNGIRLKLDRTTTDAVLQFGELLDSYGLGGLAFLQGIRKESIAGFYELLATLEQGPAARVKLGELLLERQITDLTLIPPKVTSTSSEDVQVQANVCRRRCVETYTTGMLTLGTAGLRRRATAGQRRRQAQVVRSLVELSEESPDDVMNLAAIRDPSRAFENHVMGTTVLSLSVGQRLGLNRRDMLRLGLCAMHTDIGEGQLPEGLLDKKETLMPDERKEMETHPVRGFAHVLNEHGFNVHSLERALVSLEHHLNFDSSGGYPDIQRGELHIFSRVVAICDAYNALLSDRPHRKAFPPDQAVKIIARQAGTRFDPMLTKLFLASVGKYPPGSLVELNTGEVAVVYGAGEGDHPMSRPRVVLVKDYMGNRLTPRIVDLHDQIPGRKAFKRSIVRPLDPAQHDVTPSGYLFHNRLGVEGTGWSESGSREPRPPAAD